MRNLFLILFCLLIVVYVSAARPLTSLSTPEKGGQPTKEVSLEPIGNAEDDEEKIKVDGGIKGSRVLRGGEEEGNKETEDELVYYVDYHGVSTHPPPHP